MIKQGYAVALESSNKELKIQKKKDKIIKVAYPFFLKYGYENTSLQMIVKESGGSLATIYELFKNKENLFKEAILLNFTNFTNEFNATLEKIDSQNDKSSLQDYLEALGTKLLREITSKESTALHRLIVIEGYKNPEILQIFNTTCVEQSINFFSNKLKEYQIRNSIEIPNLTESILLFIDLLINPYMWHSLTDPNFNPPSENEIKVKVQKSIKIFMFYINTKENQ